MDDNILWCKIDLAQFLSEYTEKIGKNWKNIEKSNYLAEYSHLIFEFD